MGLAVLMLLFLAACMGSASVRGEAESTTDYRDIIVSPQNQALYHTNQLTLNVTFYTYFNPQDYYNITYLIDGGSLQDTPRMHQLQNNGPSSPNTHSHPTLPIDDGSTR